MSANIQRILTKKMTRKEFLVYVGMLLLTVCGISSTLKNISNLSATKRTSQLKKPLGKTTFGSGAYGV